MNKVYLTLQATEQALVTATATIYAGYVQAGKVEDGSEASWMTRSISEALAIAKEVDDRTFAEGEMD